MTSTTHFTSKHAHWITPTYFALVFYTVGSSFLDGFAMYHTWRFVGEAEFVNMHIESGSRIVPFLVFPAMVMTIFTVLLFWHRPRVVSKTLVWAVLICTIIPWLSSAFIQIPMQFQLDQGKNMELLEKLIVTDWIRVVPTIVLGIIAFVMLRKSIVGAE